MKNYYAGYSYMGLNFTYDSPCWQVLAFSNKQDRENYIKKYGYDGQKYVVETINKKTACKIAHDLYKLPPEKSWRVVCF